MQQPIIDPDKVNAWTASMRDAFGGSDLATLITVVIVITAFAALISATWWSSHHPQKSGR